MNLIITALISVGLSIGAYFGIDSTKPLVTPEVRTFVKQEIKDSSRDTQIAMREYLAKSQADSVILGSTLPIAGSTYTLSGSGVTSSATSITLTSLTLHQNGYEIVDADLSDTFFITLEPGNRSRQEIVSCTTVTQNANNTATLSGCTRGLSPISPYTASSSLKFSHAGGAQVVFSDPPQLFNKYAAKDNDETITGYWTVPTPVAAGGIVNKSYADTLSFGAVATSTESSVGFVELATTLEQASSTILGSTGAPAVLQAKNATSTYNASTAALKVVVTGNNGRIDNNFIATSTLLAATSTINIGAFPAWHIGKQSQIITTTGTSTFSVPSGVTKLWVEVQGPGAAGGGANQSGDRATGGGAGGYSQEIVDVTGTSTIQVYVGAGEGDRTTFGTPSTAFLSATGGTIGVDSDTGFIGGIGGIGTGGDINRNGDNGGSADTLTSGAGASSLYGAGGLPQTSADVSPTTGTIACTGYGSGGAGNAESDAGNPYAGGSGCQGIIIIRW